MRPTLAENELASLGAANDGIVTWRAAQGQGLSHHVLTHHQGDGRLVRLGRGVWRLRDHPFDLRSRCRAALAMAGTGSVLGLRTAARLHGCWAFRRDERVEVIRRRGMDHRTDIGRYVETRWLPPAHVAIVEDLPVTSIGRTFFDLCGDPDPGLSLQHPVHEQRMRQLYNDCLARRGMTFTMEAAVLSVLARRGRRGTRLVREILKTYGPKHTPTRSDVETLFLELVRTYDLPAPELQAVIAGWAGFIGTVDFAWRLRRLVVEVDSSWHDGPLDQESDADRDRLLRAAGFRVMRYRFGDIAIEPARVARELAAALSVMTDSAAARTGSG